MYWLSPEQRAAIDQRPAPAPAPPVALHVRLGPDNGSHHANGAQRFFRGAAPSRTTSVVYLGLVALFVIVLGIVGDTRTQLYALDDAPRIMQARSHACSAAQRSVHASCVMPHLTRSASPQMPGCTATGLTPPGVSEAIGMSAVALLALWAAVITTTAVACRCGCAVAACGPCSPCCNDVCAVRTAMGLSWACTALATILWWVHLAFLDNAARTCELCHTFRGISSGNCLAEPCDAADTCQAMMPNGLGTAASIFGLVAMALKVPVLMQAAAAAAAVAERRHARVQQGLFQYGVLLPMQPPPLQPLQPRGEVLLSACATPEPAMRV
jgi:hypothetical protein